MLKVKICGVRNAKDALLVTNCGADFIGFNFYKESLRKVSLNMCRDIVAKLPGFILPVGVFVNESIDETAKIANKCGLKYVQLHGGESVEYISRLKAKTHAKVIKAFRISSEGNISEMKSYIDIADLFLLDTFLPGVDGGTGEAFNWDIALKVKELNKPFFLAGGLTPENISEAVDKVRPFGVDVASGVERLPRRKDFDKLKAFITNARKV